MKKYISILLSTAMLGLVLTSCVEDYLNKAPESGLTTEDVFSKYENFKKFFDSIYEGNKKDGDTWRAYNIKNGYPLYFEFWDQKYTLESLTDMSDMGRVMDAQVIKSGQISAIINKMTYDPQRRPILGSMFSIIRICNITLKNIGALKDVNQVDINDFKGQAHFIRAFAHFELFRLWGPMPYLNTVIGPDDAWDIARLSKHETLVRIAADMDSAATFFAQADLMRRDPGPGVAGHLNNPEQKRPTGVAAKAYKARALLYAASPLNNERGAADWEEAAKANWEAIQIAEKSGYDLLSLADYKKNYIGTTYSNEQLWAWYAGTKAYNAGDLNTQMNGVFGGGKTGWSGECPTQNTVDKFETKWGEPLNTAADRQAAAAAGHYNEQDPYKDRDPRFYIDIIYNTAPIPGYSTAKIYYETNNGAAVYAQLLDPSYAGITRTGYYERKTWGEQSVNNKTTPQYTDPLIRLGELYLNYAEAANEAYGPNGMAPGATASALQALNKIRTRAGMPNVLQAYSLSKDKLRERIKNERTIELCFEGSHYYHDIRRWKDAPQVMGGPLYRVDIEKVPVSTTYPTGYKYTRMPMSADRQTRWKDAMYYLPFNTEDMYKMKNFVSNELW
ncbi:RagB/SusD family nutrient uptake outer membrane protein [Dyadobacter sp. LHD-138]|uniref:RagB/SusD family nutrient uptake outer membrane protein n=1 Tax=Dyadobacter sp. LHD-138 TaxID=3071413 RepID=UPI0027DF2B74|nr:RagB/SusD family nutrient uptake outer membrane protein [Dyadobacter sp. LHD-138]MDQ6477946.1 RagB/SusD family nutrient uptake outer membrane protein [Dyadobacter sp. LHD-138]